jgi:hypothetical protein
MARRFTRETLEAWRLDDFVDTAVLLVSELVTNAVLHARSGVEVVVDGGPGRVRVEVHDSSIVLPSRRHYGIQAGTGRGILLVEEMASGWGAETTESGKVVWFELAPGARGGGGFLDAAILDDLADLGVDTGMLGAPALGTVEADDRVGRIDCLVGTGAGLSL